MDNCVYIEINSHVWCGGEKKKCQMCDSGFTGWFYGILEVLVREKTTCRYCCHGYCTLNGFTKTGVDFFIDFS